MKLIPYLVAAMLLLSFSQASAQQYGVLAKVYGVFDKNTQTYQYTDSLVFNYSAGRGSSFNNEVLLFDSSEAYKKLTFEKNYVPRRTWKFTYNSSNDFLLKRFYNASGFNKFLDFEDSFFYNGNGKLLEEHRYMGSGINNLFPTVFYKYVYNANGDVAQKETHRWSGAVSKIEYVNYYYYDANRNLIKDSLEYDMASGLSPHDVRDYTYDASNNLIKEEYKPYYPTSSGSPQVSGRYYYYNASGQIEGDSTQTYFPLYPNYHPDDVRTTYVYNAQGLLSVKTNTVMKYQATSLKEKTVNIYTYTSFGYVARDVREEDVYGGNASNNKYIIKYYYSLGMPLLTNTVHASNQDLTVYPVPTSNMLNIRWDAQQTTQVQARLVNSMGQIVKQWSDKVDGIYTKQILTHNLPNGMYYIVLQADGVEMKKALIITH